MNTAQLQSLSGHEPIILGGANTKQFSYVNLYDKFSCLSKVIIISDDEIG